MNVLTQTKGAFFEAQARIEARRLGYQLLEKNLWWGRYEIDLLAWDEKTNEMVVIEVRGRTGAGDWERFGAKKQLRLTFVADSLATTYQKPVRIELFQATGSVPQSKWKRWLSLLMGRGVSWEVVPVD